jgi:membrane-bound lytic murein transglycosylase D
VVSQHGAPPDEPVIPKMPVKPVTREHLVKLLAIACVIREPDRFNVSLPTLPSEQRLVKVDIDNSMPITRAASHAGMSPDDLKDMNAAFRNGVVDSNASPYLMLPSNKVQQFRNSLSAENSGGAQTIPGTASLPPLGAALSAAGQDDDGSAASGKGGASSRTHTVKSGESLWSIARRYSVDIKKLELWNHLQGAVVKPGQVLKISAPG